MFETKTYEGDWPKQYDMLSKQLDALLMGEDYNQVANLSNASALLNQFLDRINWVGFYLTDMEQNQLVLGPFQGLPACVRIPFGRGFCGTSAAEQVGTQRIDDVHQFPGHIARDTASNSELVIPLVKDGQMIDVLDIGSPEFNHFDELDQAGLEAFCTTLHRHL
jgi:GAF domain-containing protein